MSGERNRPRICGCRDRRLGFQPPVRGPALEKGCEQKYVGAWITGEAVSQGDRGWTQGDGGLGEREVESRGVDFVAMVGVWGHG